VRVSYLLTLVLVPAVARSEVMDKEWSFTAVVIFAIAGAIGAFLASRYRPWLLGAVLLVVGVFFAGQYAELLDPAVGPAIRREAGAFYVLMSWSGLLFVLAGAVIGLVLRQRIHAARKTH
jgi:predicted membrane channel-forming protein YqfA (hemolysin III family)